MTIAAKINKNFRFKIGIVYISIISLILSLSLSLSVLSLNTPSVDANKDTLINSYSTYLGNDAGMVRNSQPDDWDNFDTIPKNHLGVRVVGNSLLSSTLYDEGGREFSRYNKDTGALLPRLQPMIKDNRVPNQPLGNSALAVAGNFVYLITTIAQT